MAMVLLVGCECVGSVDVGRLRDRWRRGLPLVSHRSRNLVSKLVQ